MKQHINNLMKNRDVSFIPAWWFHVIRVSAFFKIPVPAPVLQPWSTQVKPSSAKPWQTQQNMNRMHYLWSVLLVYFLSDDVMRLVFASSS